VASKAYFKRKFGRQSVGKNSPTPAQATTESVETGRGGWFWWDLPHIKVASFLSRGLDCRLRQSPLIRPSLDIYSPPLVVFFISIVDLPLPSLRPPLTSPLARRYATGIFFLLDSLLVACAGFFFSPFLPKLRLPSVLYPLTGNYSPISSTFPGICLDILNDTVR